VAGDIEAKAWRADLGPDDEDDRANDKAFAAICFTVHHAHHHLLDNTGELASVAWARLSERFKPTDNASMHELNSSLQQASIEDYKHDAEAYYSKFVTICGRLASADQAVSEQMQITNVEDEAEDASGLADLAAEDDADAAEDDAEVVVEGNDHMITSSVRENKRKELERMWFVIHVARKDIMHVNAITWTVLLTSSTTPS